MDEITKEDLSFEYSHRHYQILYHGVKIGGAGSEGESRGHNNQGNRDFHRQQAELTIRDILNGRIADFMRKHIEDIQNFERAKHENKSEKVGC